MIYGYSQINMITFDEVLFDYNIRTAEQRLTVQR